MEPRPSKLIIPAILLATALPISCADSALEPLEGAIREASQPLDTCMTLARYMSFSTEAVDAVLSTDPSDPTKANTNYGAVARAVTGFVGTETRRELLRFNLSYIPPEASVHSATLTLRMIQSLGKAPVLFYPATTPWSEPTVTWNTFFSAPSGGYDANRLLATLVTHGVPNNAPVTLDITDIVAEWLSGTTPNNGLLLDHPAAGRTILGTSEAPSLAPRPSLEVCYALPSCADGVQNQGETGVDCGGPCEPCVI